MPYVTEYEVRHPGREPVTRDVVMKRMPRRPLPISSLGGVPYKVVTDFSPLYGAPGMGNIVEDVTSIFRGLAKATGIINPLTYYEPGKTPQEIWTKYNADVTYYQGRVPQLTVASTRAKMQKELDPIVQLRDRLKPRFAPGAALGERDLENLGDLVFALRQWRKDMNDAEKEVGLSIPSTSTPAPAAAPAKSGMGGVAMLIGGLLVGKWLKIF